MRKKLTTDAELRANDGKKVTCEIHDTEILDGEISVEGSKIFILQNERDGLTASELKGYKYSWVVSNETADYTHNNRLCEDITLKDSGLKRGDRVWVSDTSVEHAIDCKRERIFLADVGGKTPFVVVSGKEEPLFPDGNYASFSYRYAVPVPEKESEMTFHCRIDDKELELTKESMLLLLLGKENK